MYKMYFTENYVINLNYVDNFVNVEQNILYNYNMLHPVFEFYRPQTCPDLL